MLLFRRMKRLLGKASLFFLVAASLPGCGGGGASPSSSLIQYVDTYNGPVADSKKPGYQSEIFVTESNDHPNSVELVLMFYVSSSVNDPSNSGSPKEYYRFYPLASQYPDGWVPIADSHIHAAMALYPPNKSIDTTSPICNVTVDATLTHRETVDATYSSSDCSMIGKGTIHAPFLEGFIRNSY